MTASSAPASSENLPGTGLRTIPPQLWGLFITLFIEIFGSALTIPVFTYFCIVELGLTATYVGAITSGFSAAQLLGAPLVGRISDAVGRRPTLLACFLWTSLCFFATSGVNSYRELLLVRTFAGASGGSVSITQAMVMDASAPRERPTLLGFYGGLLGFAFTLGPGAVTIALALYPVERRFVFIAASLFALMGCLIGGCVLQETLPEHKRRPLFRSPGHSEAEVGAERSMTSDVWSICNRGLVCVWLGRFCSTFAFLSLFTTYSFLIRDSFGWRDKEFGIILCLCGLVGAFTQLCIYPPMSRTLGRQNCFVLGCLFVCIFFITLPVVTLRGSRPMHVACQVFFIIGSSLIDPGVPDLVARYAPEDRMGLAQGITNAFRSMAAVIAPVVAGKAYDVSPYVVYSQAAVVVVLAGAFVSFAPTSANELCASKLLSASEVEDGERQPLMKK